MLQLFLDMTLDGKLEITIRVNIVAGDVAYINAKSPRETLALQRLKWHLGTRALHLDITYFYGLTQATSAISTPSRCARFWSTAAPQNWSALRSAPGPIAAVT